MPLWGKKPSGKTASREKKAVRKPARRSDPSQPTNTPKIRYVLVGLALSAVIVGLVWWVMTMPLLELKDVAIKGKSGAMKHVSQSELNSVTKKWVKGNLLTADMNAIQNAFEKLPWVRSVSVRRLWPDTLEVVLEEHQPLARWGSGGLVNVDGEQFNGATKENLPVFSGPEGSEGDVAQQYRLFSELLKPVQRKPLEVSLSARRAWQIKLDDGAVLELGRSDTEKRLARFVSVYGKTAGQPGVLARYVDLRYSNGIAMKLAAAKTETETGTKQ